MAAYGLLAGLLLYAICGRRRPRARDVVVAVLLAIAYGVTDELHQAVVPGRTGRIDDLVIDALGALVGAAGAWLALTWLEARRQGTEAVDPSVRHPADR
jgi:VanZ family protein